VQNQFQDDLARLEEPHELTHNPFLDVFFVGFNNGRYKMQTWLQQVYPEDEKLLDNRYIKKYYSS